MSLKRKREEGRMSSIAREIQEQLNVSRAPNGERLHFVITEDEQNALTDKTVIDYIVKAIRLVANQDLPEFDVHLSEHKVSVNVLMSLPCNVILNDITVSKIKNIDPVVFGGFEYLSAPSDGGLLVGFNVAKDKCYHLTRTYTSTINEVIQVPAVIRPDDDSQTMKGTHLNMSIRE